MGRPATHRRPMRFNKLDLNWLVALDAMLNERGIRRAAEALREAARDALLPVAVQATDAPPARPAVSPQR